MRLHFVVEGQTEETFVRTVLAPELWARGVYCDAHRVTTGRRLGRSYRGGLVSFAHLRRDLDLWIKQDRAADSWFTTMVDLYKLPSDFPALAESRQILDPFRKVDLLEENLSTCISHPRFVPYIQLHEFEALLFSDVASFSIAFPGLDADAAGLEAIRSAFETPEHIDEREDMAPSKRILRIRPQYDKRVAGPLIAKQIGLAKLRKECRHFDAWLAKLESAATINE